MELIARVDGRERLVTLKALENDHFEITIDGRMHLVDCRERVANLYSLLIGEDSYEVRVGDSDARGRIETQLYEEGYLLEITDPMKAILEASGRKNASGEASVEAVMPGKVLRIAVAEGDRVEEGQPILVLVAMKMENEIEAPKSGTVKSIHVGVNDSVETGALLITIA
ncbi:MAG: biotin/lipoyl-binding protein [Acidobacteria bacterium]|nr:biotin/lipoyl-binding protein [Acidobacteriota bacterium]